MTICYTSHSCSTVYCNVERGAFGLNAQVIKLPANKFTVREKEMLSNVVPAEFFEAAKSPWVSSVLGLGLLISLVYIWRIKSDDD